MSTTASSGNGFSLTFIVVVALVAGVGYFSYTDTYFEMSNDWCVNCGQFSDYRYYHIGSVRFLEERTLSRSVFADILAELRGPCPKHLWKKHHGGGHGFYSNISDSCYRPSFWGYFSPGQVSRYRKIDPAGLRAFMEDVLRKDRDQTWGDDEEPKVFCALSDITSRRRAEAFRLWWESQKRSPATTPDYWEWIKPIRALEKGETFAPPTASAPGTP